MLTIVTTSRSDHVLMLVEGFYPQTGGGARTQWEVARTAIRNEYRVSVFTPKLSVTPQFETKDGVEIHRPFSGAPNPNNPNSAVGFFSRIVFSTLLLLYLMAWCWCNRPAVVYSPSHLTHPVAKILGILYGIPIINFVAYSPVLRDDELARYDFRRLFESMNFRLFMGDVVFSRTPQVSELLQTHSDCRVLQAHGILNETEFVSMEDWSGECKPYSKFGIPASTRFLCWVGRVVSIKRPRLAIDVLERLPSGYHLVMVGDGPFLDEIKAYVPQRLEDRIHFAGLLPHDETLRMIATADGLLVTSETEAYPTVVFEALALQTPVYAPPVGVLPRLSEHHLHIAAPERFPTVIEESDGTSGPGIDPEILGRYSIARLGDDIIEQVDELINDSGSVE